MPVEKLPQEWVMSTDDMVDAALAGFDAGEFATIPALPRCRRLEHRLQSARLAPKPNLSHAKPASRYGVR